MTAQGQTFNDRVLAARHSIAGQGLAKAVCKATTEEIIGPKKKHLDYLLHCTNEPNVSIPTLANLLIERTQNPNWVVVFKSLITTHHLMCYGNERFTQYLASSSSNFQLSAFLDKGGVQGYDMSPFIRRYANYMSEKSKSYRNVAFDFCKVKRGKDGGTLRQMTAEKLLKTLPHLQAQIDSLLEFDCSAQDLNNGVINACFMLLFRDLIRLFACYNDGIINLLEKYFEMQKKQAREALDIYKKFLLCMDRVGEFLKVAENVGIDKGDIPDLTRAPSSLLEALEAHLASLEGRKPGSGGTTPTGNARMNVAAVVNSLANASNAFGAASGDVIDEKTAAGLLQEEEAAMEKFRSTASASNPFAAPPAPEAEETPNILDLFGVSAPAATSAPPAPVSAAPAAPLDFSSAAASTKASDDLLQLSGNPFANMLNAAGSGQPVNYSPAPAFNTSGSGFPSLPSQPGQFTNENAFNNIFGTNGTSATNVLQPQGSSNNTNKDKMITGDLDSSLANLASNLNFGNQKRGGLVPQPRGPPMAGLNAMQSQPMIGEFVDGSQSSGQLPPSQSFSSFPPGNALNPTSSSSAMLTPSPSLPSLQSSTSASSFFPSNSSPSNGFTATSSAANDLSGLSFTPAPANGCGMAANNLFTTPTPNLYGNGIPGITSLAGSGQKSFNTSGAFGLMSPANGMNTSTTTTSSSMVQQNPFTGQDLFFNNNNNIGDKHAAAAAFGGSPFAASTSVGGGFGGQPFVADFKSPGGVASSPMTAAGGGAAKLDPFADLL